MNHDFWGQDQNRNKFNWLTKLIVVMIQQMIILTDAMKSTNRHDMPGATAIGGVTRAGKDCHQEKF